MANNNRRNGSFSYVGAPYNFVPFSEKVYEYPEKQLPAHNSVSEDLLSGEIPYTVKARTPIIIDDGSGHFYKDNYDRYAIPGSSMRGLIRSNVQVLSLSSLDDDIDDYSLMYRHVSSPKLDDYGDTLGADSITIDNGESSQQISVLKKVRAGYVKKEKGGYYIYKTVLENLGENFDCMNYYVLSERRVVKEYLAAKSEGRKSKFDFFAPNGKSIMENTVKKEFEQYLQGNKLPEEVETETLDEEAKECTFKKIETDRNGKTRIKAIILPKGKEGESGFLLKNKTEASLYQKGENGKYILIVKSGIHYAGEPNNDYKPYNKACSYEAEGHNIICVGKPGEYSNKGWAVSSGKMNEKKAIYIIPEIDPEKTPFKLPPKDVKAFEIDLNAKKTQLKKLPYGKNVKWTADEEKKEKWAEYFDLPKKDGEQKPIFYIESGDRYYFGFTPHLRLFYKHSIKEGIPATHKKGNLDYAKAMFGFTGEDDSYKSRVSFSDAVIISEPKNAKSMCVMQGPPKPSSYLDYVIQQNGKMISYNANKFQLRGMKQYWLRHEIGNYTETASRPPFTPLEEKTEFEGKIRFHNLKKEELGLLLWAVVLDGKSWLNIGKGKAFGFGVIQLEVGEVRIVDTQKAYDLSELILDPLKTVETKEYIDCYKKQLKSAIGGKNPEEDETIKTFFLMKNSENMPDAGKIRYMDIDRKEYQNRVKYKIPLQTIEEVLDKTSANANDRSGSRGSSNANTRSDSRGSSNANTRSDSRGSSNANTRSDSRGSSNTDTINAVVRSVDPYGNVYLDKSDKVKMYARILSKKLNGRKLKVGDSVQVVYEGPQINKQGKEFHNYRIV